MNVVYDLRGLPYDAATLMAGIPPGYGVGCSPIALDLSSLPDRIHPTDRGVKSTGLLPTFGIRPPQLIAANNFNARIHCMFRSRTDRGQRVRRTIRCEACDITLNSEQQASQHYKGKFHQRKLRQQTQKSFTSGDSTSECASGAEKSGGVKRSSEEISDQHDDGHSVKVHRGDSDSNAVNEESTQRPETSNSLTNTILVSDSAEEKTTMPKLNNEMRRDAFDESSIETVSTKGVIALEKKKELEIKIELKNSQKSASENVIGLTGPGSIPMPGINQFTPLAAAAQHPRAGVYLASHPILSCHSIALQSSFLPSQNTWFLPTLPTPNVHSHNHCSVGLNNTTTAAVCSSKDSTGFLISDLTQQRINLSGHSNPSPELNHASAGFPFSLVMMHPATPSYAMALNKSTDINVEKTVLPKGHDPTSNNLGNVIAQNHHVKESVQRTISSKHLWQGRPNQTQTFDSVGMVNGVDLDHLDPVSRAVYNNLLGYFTTQKPRSRFGRHR